MRWLKLCTDVKLTVVICEEVKWRDACGKLVEGKDSRFKLFWAGNYNGMGAVEILLAEKWMEAIF